MIESRLAHSLFWCLMTFPFSQFYFGFYFGQAKQALELREHRAKHGPDATLGPYGPYRDWPPKIGREVDDQGVPGAPGREAADVEGGPVDPMTGEALAPLHHEGSPRLAFAGLLGMLFGVATPRKLSKNFGNFVVAINRCIVIPFAFYDSE
jgi:hypothetical protein